MSLCVYIYIYIYISGLDMCPASTCLLVLTTTGVRSDGKCHNACQPMVDECEQNPVCSDPQTNIKIG